MFYSPGATTSEALIVVVATVDEHSGLLLSGPDIVSRGFVYVKESEEPMTQAKQISEDSLNRALSKKAVDRTQLKTVVKDDLARFIYKETKRKPMILPIIMDL